MWYTGSNTSLSRLTFDGNEWRAAETYTLPALVSDQQRLVGNVNGDGDMDFWATKGSFPYDIYWVDGSNGQISGSIFNGHRFDAGDLDGDGAMDLVGYNLGTKILSVLMNDGSGSFNTFQYPIENTYSYSVVIDPRSSYPKILLPRNGGIDYLANIDGTWEFGTAFERGNNYLGDALFVDYDNDGEIEAIFRTYTSWGINVGFGSIEILKDLSNNQMKLDRIPYSVSGAQADTPRTYVSDVDADGVKELVTLDSYRTTGSVLGYYDFDSEGRYSRIRLTSQRFNHVAFIDWDNDGDLDLVGNHYNSSSVGPERVLRFYKNTILAPVIKLLSLSETSLERGQGIQLTLSGSNFNSVSAADLRVYFGSGISLAGSNSSGSAPVTVVSDSELQVTVSNVYADTPLGFRDVTLRYGPEPGDRVVLKDAFEVVDSATPIKTYSGMITEGGLPKAGVTVNLEMIAGTLATAVTDLNGRFSMNVAADLPAGLSYEIVPVVGGGTFFSPERRAANYAGSFYHFDFAASTSAGSDTLVIGMQSTLGTTLTEGEETILSVTASGLTDPEARVTGATLLAVKSGGGLPIAIPLLATDDPLVMKARVNLPGGTWTLTSTVNVLDPIRKAIRAG